MDRVKFDQVVENAVAQRACRIVEIQWNDDDNVFEIVITKEDGDVKLEDCEFVHRAVLSEFDRNIEDYALTVGSAGLSSEEADELLRNIDDN